MTVLANPGRISSRRKRRTGPVRVCFLIDRLSRAGTETQLLALVRSLDRSRVLPHLCLLDGRDELSRSLEPADCPTLRLELTSLVGLRTLQAIKSVRGFWRKHRIDVLQTYFLDSTYFGVPLGRLSGVRRIVRVRNNLGYWLTGRHRTLGRWVGRLADATLTNSDDGKRAITEAESLSSQKVVVLENGVDLDRFPVTRAPDTGGDIVHVGAVANLRPVKNIDGLVRVAARLRSAMPQLVFEVAGDGEQCAELESLIREHRLERSFRLAGSVADVPRFLARLDVAVLCSHSEGMSNALLEYMASGRAIVATDVGANGQLVRHGIDGLIVPARDEEALAQAITAMLRDADAARAMGASARQRVESQYSREAMVRRFEDFYEQLVA